MILAALATIENDDQRNELAEIYESNKKMFYKVAYSKLHSNQDVEDVINEAFLIVADNIEAFFNISENKRVSYINGIIKNISYRTWNKKQKIKEKYEELDENIVYEGILPEQKVLSDFACDQILKFIDTMPETTKSALYFKTNLGMKNADIAKALGISEEAVKKRISRAIAQIRKFTEEMENG